MVDMVFLVFVGLLYPPSTWKVFLGGQKSSPNDFVSVVVVYAFFFSASSQRKTKGQELKGKLVSYFSHFFRTFSKHFQNLSPRTFPFKTKGFSTMRTKEKKR